MATSFRKQNKAHAGFTLMEVMVAVSIFAIVMTVGIGALLTINDSYRKSQTQRQGIDSLTYVLEAMSRRIRTAQEWSATNNYGTSDSHFTFKDQDGVTVTYNWIGNKVTMTIDNTGVQNPSLVDGQYDMTPDSVTISNMSFTPFRSAGQQPYLQINIQGVITNGKAVSDFAFQTGVSKRTGDTP
jgi:prepilin-type N-terminal cleavage/methylation domain-containing protein